MPQLSTSDDAEQLRSFVLAKDVMGAVISHWSYELAMAETAVHSDATMLAELETHWRNANDLWYALRPDRPAQLAAVIRWYGPWVKRQLATS